MAPDDEDSTEEALEVLRGLPAQRLADQEAERSAVQGTKPEQAALALAILGERRPWNIDDRRTLGLSRAADEGAWLATVERRLGELDPDVVVDRWLVAVEAHPNLHVLPAVAAALGRLPSLAPFADRLEHLLRAASRWPQHLVRDALVESSVTIDAAALGLLHRILVDPVLPGDRAAAALLIAGAFARRAPEAAALIAERVRADRSQVLRDADARLPIDQHVAISTSILAEAVHASGCPSLSATVLLELERGYDRARWAKALLAIAGDAGARYLARMRGRPGWSALAGTPPEVPADPLEGLTSPLADVRRAALVALAEAPRPDHLQAFLLGAELDRYTMRTIYRTSWQGLTPIPWLPLLRAHAGTWRPTDSFLAHTAPGTSLLREQIAVMRADLLLDELLDANSARTEMAVPQALTPALRELAEEGVEAFVPRVATPPLSAEERAALEAEEAELAALAGEVANG
ncbi:MAG TPA: hypothetical protein VN253_12080 [Kofleriaceae bacterium]|nr:hypothetical protein [Kofleriaceae bacterium]